MDDVRFHFHPRISSCYVTWRPNTTFLLWWLVRIQCWLVLQNVWHRSMSVTQLWLLRALQEEGCSIYMWKRIQWPGIVFPSTSVPWFRAPQTSCPWQWHWPRFPAKTFGIPHIYCDFGGHRRAPPILKIDDYFTTKHLHIIIQVFYVPRTPIRK